MPSFLMRCVNQSCAEGGKPFCFEFMPSLAQIEPVCPKCGIKANDPKLGYKLIRLVRTHYQIPGTSPAVRACDPFKGIEAFDLFHNATPVPIAVNCPECRATPAWEAAFLAGQVDEPAATTKAKLDRLETFIPHV